MDDVESVRRAIVGLTRRRSLRDVASLLGTSHFVIHKLVKGKKIRPTTVQHLREALEDLGHEDPDRHLRGLWRHVASELGLPTTRKVDRAIRELLVAAYRSRGREPPRWLRVRASVPRKPIA